MWKFWKRKKEPAEDRPVVEPAAELADDDLEGVAGGVMAPRPTIQDKHGKSPGETLKDKIADGTIPRTLV